MKDVMSKQRLEEENDLHVGTGGRSQENADVGFRPAFFDYASQKLYFSRFIDGRLAPVHMLDGLPEEVVVDRAPDGRVIRARASLVSGFERNGYFYTRKAAARAVAAIKARRRSAVAKSSGN
ncbi:MAG TPA: hypothetical protein VEG27_12745 [Usitatibacter sp.]|nr:hypothetical protein [Usitatibacter sp.]